MKANDEASRMLQERPHLLPRASASAQQWSKERHGSHASVCEQAGIPAAAAPEYAVKQWATCSVFPNATHTEFCDWALRVQHVPAPYNQLDPTLAASLLGSFLGNVSKYTATCVWLLACGFRLQAVGPEQGSCCGMLDAPAASPSCFEKCDLAAESAQAPSSVLAVRL